MSFRGGHTENLAASGPRHDARVDGSHPRVQTEAVNQTGTLPVTRARPLPACTALRRSVAGLGIFAAYDWLNAVAWKGLV